MTQNSLRRFAMALVGILAVHCSAASRVQAEAPATPAGYWEGEIKLPGTALGVHVRLRNADAAWSGTIDIPVQGIRDFELKPVQVTGGSVRFAMPGIPGDPTFAGRLSAGGERIAGDFTQAGQKFRFVLQRSEAPAPASDPQPVSGVPGEGLAGFWYGVLKASPIIELRLTLEINDKGDGKFDGVLVSLDQGNARIPLTATTAADGAVDIRVPKVHGTFDGTFNADGSELVGHWKQLGPEMPLTFKRQAQPARLNRPQEPTKPYPYRETEVTVDGPSADVKLAGTFTVPRGPGPHPAVVLVTGSGPQDRDEAVMGHRPFFVLADHLTRQGIAVLRCDDRGVGKSTGDFGTATHTDFVDDALAALDWLRRRPEVDPRRVGLIGHSEGGIIAPLAAVRRPNDVAFIVLMAGVGVPMQELLVRQATDMGRVIGLSEADVAQAADSQREMLQLITSDADSAEVERRMRESIAAQIEEVTPETREALGLNDAMIEMQVQMAITPWFRQLAAYDPRPALLKVQCPVLAINGEKDLQVAAKENLAGIRDALAAGGNRDATTKVFPGLNHLFQHCTTGAVTEYGQIEETFAPEAMETISTWILQRAGQ